ELLGAADQDRVGAQLQLHRRRHVVLVDGQVDGLGRRLAVGIGNGDDDTVVGALYRRRPGDAAGRRVDGHDVGAAARGPRQAGGQGVAVAVAGLDVVRI